LSGDRLAKRIDGNQKTSEESIMQKEIPHDALAASRAGRVVGKVARVARFAGAACLVTVVGATQAASNEVVLTRNAAVGAKFAAPGPRTCSSRSQPASGSLSAANARAYVICGSEMDYQGGAENLFLFSQVKVQVSRGRPYEHVRDSLQDIDPHKLVYDIRGSSVAWVCGLPGGPNKPCARTVNPNDEGKCYQTTFDEWRCTWGDFSVSMSTDTRLMVAPPTLAEAE
jgi:hypothetical protein